MSIHVSRISEFVGCLAASFISITIGAKADSIPPLAAPSGSLVQDYCSSFVEEAKKARESREKLEIQTLKDQLDAKLKEVNDKTVLLTDWVKRREAILATATESVVKIYKAMDPAAAALELSKLDEVTTSAILRVLDAKRASAILVEMDPKRAALIVAIMASDSNLKKGTKS